MNSKVDRKNIEQDKLLNNLFKQRNIRSNTRRGYITALTSYTNYQKMSLQNLIREAEQEEEERIPLKKRKIKKRIINYRTHLINTEIAPNTIKNYMSKVHTFYNHYEIEIPVIPPFKQVKEYELNYDDIPSKQDIKKVCDTVPVDFKALILFMSSSGTSRAETLSLTVDDFIKATMDYHSDVKSIQSILHELSQQDNIIPTWYIRRIKTDKFYYTYSSSESSNAIIEYLKTRENLKKEDKLFPISKTNLTRKFEDVNDYFNWGFRGHYRYFRAHALRKFHASNLDLPAEYIDMLEGRSKNKIHATYIKTNPKKLKKIYMQHVHDVTIYDRITDATENNEETHELESSDIRETVSSANLSEYIQCLVLIEKINQRVDYIERKLINIERRLE